MKTTLRSWCKHWAVKNLKGNGCIFNYFNIKTDTHTHIYIYYILGQGNRTSDRWIIRDTHTQQTGSEGFLVKLCSEIRSMTLTTRYEWYNASDQKQHTPQTIWHLGFSSSTGRTLETHLPTIASIFDDQQSRWFKKVFKQQKLSRTIVPWISSWTDPSIQLTFR